MYWIVDQYFGLGRGSLAFPLKLIGSSNLPNSPCSDVTGIIIFLEKLNILELLHKLTDTYILLPGWGTTEFSGPKSDTLQAVNLSVVPVARCAGELPDNVITTSQICTFAPGKDACQSDSGGPLYIYNSNTGRLLQVGIISYGLSCATDVPGVNTRVTSYLTWIVSVTSGKNLFWSVSRLFLFLFTCLFCFRRHVLH